MAVISKKVPGFLPSTSGFHFANNYPKDTPFPMITLPIVNRIIVSGDAGNGICGGFTFTVLDMFLTTPRTSPPIDVVRPDPDTQQYKYLAQRQVDSFERRWCILNGPKIIEWVAAPDDDSSIKPNDGMFHGLGYRTVKQEWLKIKKDIDSGKPSPLMLVMGPRCTTADIQEIINTLGHSHQVLAYAYSLDDQNNLKLWIYECNHPDEDESTIDLNISSCVQSNNIIGTKLQIPWQIRGFFRSYYEKVDPKPFRSIN